MLIYKGNTYKLPIKLKIREQLIYADDVKAVEFSFGNIIKKYPDNVTFEGETFIVPLTQDDTFSLDETSNTNYQARVFFNDESVKCTDQLKIDIRPSISKVVLK